MTFTSYTFMAFCILLFALYYVIPKKVQWQLLLVASVAFYASYNVWYLAFIIVTTVSAYLATIKISDLRKVQNDYLKQNPLLTKEEKKAYKAKVKSKTWAWLLFCVLLNFGILFALKYVNFAIHNLNALLSIFTDSSIPLFEKLFFPIGISFYTFQTMGYVIDVYFGKYEAERNPFKLFLFASFFPQLLQGPINRYNITAPSLFAEHRWEGKTIIHGFERIIWGYFKKVVIADRILIGVKTIIGSPDKYTGIMVVVGMLFYAAQLYCDFTGGIDITIGIAEVFGVKFSENFDRPFFSKNVAEYWRRWHITLGTWFKDYTFYPLCTAKPITKLTKFCKEKFGGSFSKRVPVYLASIILWIGTGAWHGASWNFIVWGLGNCLVILVSQELIPLYRKFHNKFPNAGNKGYYKAFQILRTNAIMCILRSFDLYSSVGETFKSLGSIVSKPHFSSLTDGTLLELGISVSDYIVIIFGIITVFTVSLIQRRGSIRERLDSKPAVFRIALFTVLTIVIIVFGAYGLGYDSGAFIYSQY